MGCCPVSNNPPLSRGETAARLDGGPEKHIVKLLNTFKWPLTLIVVTALLIVGVILIGGTALGIPETTQTTVLHWVGGVGTLVAAPLAFLFAFLARDENHDGTPDFLEDKLRNGGGGLLVLLAVGLVAAVVSTGCTAAQSAMVAAPKVRDLTCGGVRVAARLSDRLCRASGGPWVVPRSAAEREADANARLLSTGNEALESTAGGEVPTEPGDPEPDGPD